MDARARRVRVLLRLSATLAAAAGLTLAGCTQNAEPVGPEPPTQPAPVTEVDPAVITWTGSVCSALAPVVQTLAAPPTSGFADPAAAKQAYLAYIDRALGEAEQAARQVDEAGAAPVQGGDELSQDVQSRLADLQQDLMQAKAQVEQADPADPVAFGRAAAAAGNILSSMGHSALAVAAVSGDPQLNAGFDQAESCKELKMFGTPS
jgi:hypothetical protein